MVAVQTPEDELHYKQTLDKRRVLHTIPSLTNDTKQERMHFPFCPED